MIMKREVAAWLYELAPDIFNNDLSDGRLNQYMRDIIQCLDILERYELLYDITLTCEGFWTGYRGVVESFSTDNMFFWKGEKQSIKLSDAQDFAKQFEQLMIVSPDPNQYALDTHFKPAEYQDFCLYPYECYLSGQGIIYDAEGNKQEYPKGVVKLWLDSSVVAPIFELSTFSTAWLPRYINGDYQTAIYEANAPRLESALNEIDAILINKNDYEEKNYTRFAELDGNRLVNVYCDKVDEDHIPDLIEVDESGNYI